MKMDDYEKINKILSGWNPIGVPKSIASDEYRSYIPAIYKIVSEHGDLLHYLEDMLINEIGVEFDRSNPEHISDLQRVCDDIQNYKL